MHCGLLWKMSPNVSRAQILPICLMILYIAIVSCWCVEGLEWPIWTGLHSSIDYWKTDGATKRWIERHPLYAAGLNHDCVVHLLPQHHVLRSTAELAQVKTRAVKPDDLLFDLGVVKMRFARGLETGLLERGLERVSFTVELMEVWGRWSAALGRITSLLYTTFFPASTSMKSIIYEDWLPIRSPILTDLFIPVSYDTIIAGSGSSSCGDNSSVTLLLFCGGGLGQKQYREKAFFFR